MGFSGLKRRPSLSGEFPVFQLVHEVAQGGFTLDKTGHTLGSVLKSGSLVSYDEATRIARVMRGGTVVEDAADGATAYKVEKGSFIVGDKAANLVGGKSYAITAIDTTNANYDTITVSTSLGALTTGAPLFESAASGASAGAFVATPKGLLYDHTLVEDNTFISVVLRGTVYARRIPSGTAAASALPLIIFSQSR